MRLLMYFLIFSAINISAQNIKGVVVDRFNNKPIENVNIYFENNKIGTKTDKKGRFKLSLSTKKVNNNSLTFSHISYNTKTILFSEISKTDTVYLIKKNRVLDEVQLTKNKDLKKNLNFQKLAILPKNIHSFGSSLINGKIYVIGGDLTSWVDSYKKALNDFDYNELQINSSLEDFSRNVFLSSQPSFQDFNNELLIYDINANQWNIEDIGLRKRAYHNINYDKENNEIYILGGIRLSKNRSFEYLDDKIEILDPVTKSIKIDKTNPHQAVNFESFFYKNNLIVLGGSIKMDKNKEKVYTNKIHFYDLKKGLWYRLGDMPKTKETNGVLIGDKIFLFGGYNKKSLTQIESFDLITGKWKIEGDLFTGVSRPAIAKNGDTIYLFENGNIFTYNTITKNLKEYHIGIFLEASKMYFFKNKLFILGGLHQGDFSFEPSKELYSIDLKEFEISQIHKISKL
ncbi:MAG: carboxypeptidase-like regulatory domain-containing protein [Bacteroidota bacterium]